MKPAPLTVMLMVLSVGCAGERAGRPGEPGVPCPSTRPSATRPGGSEGERAAAEYDGYELVGPPRLVDALALRVNTQTITVNDVLHKLAHTLTQAGKTGDEDAFRQVAARLIRQETERQVAEAIMVVEAQKELQDKEKEHIAKLVNERLCELILDAGGARAQLDAKMRQQGASLEELTKALERQYTGRYYFEKKFLSTLVNTRREMWRYYQEHAAQFSAPQKVRMQVAAFLDQAYFASPGRDPSPEQRQQARRQALAAGQTALARVRQGEDFGLVVREDSTGAAAYRATEGGMLDLMPAGSLGEGRVEDQAFAQQAGQVSGVIEGETGAFIVKTVEVSPAKVTAFEEAQVEINRTLRTQKYEQLQVDYYRELREKAHIVPSQTFERDVLARAVQEYYRPQPADGTESSK